MIGPGGLLLVVPTFMQFRLLYSFIGGVAKKNGLDSYINNEFHVMIYV